MNGQEQTINFAKSTQAGENTFLINKGDGAAPRTGTKMEVLCYKPGKMALLAAWQRDKGTRERKLALMMEYADHSHSQLMVFSPSKMKGNDPFHVLLDLDGVDGAFDTVSIYAAYQERKGRLKVLDMMGERVSAQEAHKRLSEYAHQYERKGLCFIENGYCNFHTSIFQEKIDHLELGWKRLELQKMFDIMGLLRANGGHPYCYAIKCKEVSPSNPWFVSFKEVETLEGGEANVGEE